MKPTLRWQAVFTLAGILTLSLLLGSVLVAAGEGTQPQTPQATPPDPGFNWGNAKIGSDLLWKSGYRGWGIKVAVVDSGIDHTHPAFAGAVITMTDIITLERDGQGIILDPSDPINGPITVVNGYDTMDYTGHGSAMASIIAATDPISDAWGIAYEAEVMSIKVERLVEMENARQIFTGTLGPFGATVIDFDILTPTASSNDALDVILAWEGWSDLELEVLSPTPTTSYSPDQGGSHFTATTNIPLRARYGRWQARLTNMGSWPCSFNLAVKRFDFSLPYPVYLPLVIRKF